MNTRFLIRAFTLIWFALAAVGAGVGVQAGHAQYTEEEPAQPAEADPQTPAVTLPDSGPRRSVGETVIVPRRKEPPPPPPKPVREKINPDEVFRLRTDVAQVNVSVVVRDKKGNFIPNLRKVHFLIEEGGVPQTVQRLESSEAPMTVAMVIEFSDRYWEFLYDTMNASYGFVNSLRPEDWVAVIAYDMRSEILLDFTRNKAAAFDALSMMRIPGFSEMNLFDALTETIDRMDGIDGKKAILLVSSGVDTFSRTRYTDALDIVKASDTPVYAIGTGQAARLWYENRSYMGSMSNLNFLQADNQLRSFAKLSGGRAYFPRFEGQFPEIFHDIAASLRNEYMLSYSPTNTERDGKYRKIKVELVDQDGKKLKIVDQKGKELKYDITHREGYTAPRAVE